MSACRIVVALRRPLPYCYDSMTPHHFHTVSEAENGSRLDAFIARVSACGIREAKRRIAEGTVLVDGRTRPAHYKIRSGAMVALCRETPPSCPDMPVLAGVCENYLAFVKPAGLHTAHIAGSAAPSLEHTLAAQWESMRKVSLPLKNDPVPEHLRTVLGAPGREKPARPAILTPQAPQLLSRLDAVTSGLVLAASCDSAAETFRAMEIAGCVSKYYLAVIDGVFESALIVTNALDTANRAQTRVLPETDPDPARHTAVCPLGDAASFSIPGAKSGTTLAAVCIKRGARHQIRAHLAFAGFPVVGDAVYGHNAGGIFRLHHARLEMPECSFFCLPPWLL